MPTFARRRRALRVDRDEYIYINNINNDIILQHNEDVIINKDIIDEIENLKNQVQTLMIKVENIEVKQKPLYQPSKQEAVSSEIDLATAPPKDEIEAYKAWIVEIIIKYRNDGLNNTQISKKLESAGVEPLKSTRGWTNAMVKNIYTRSK